LQLLSGCLTPRLQEQLTRLGAWMPFGKAAVMFKDFTRVVVSEDYAQQQAADALLQQEIGVLSASTAFGKTVVAAYLIAQRKVNTLVA